jgi:malto-oligosyltrehalose trehalohydrolase
VHLVLENDRNAAARLARDERGKPAAFTAQWNDDFHHAMHVLLTGERHGYYGDYARSPLRALGRCLAQGFAYQGERSAHRRGEPRGEPSAQLPPDAFVDFLQNHDQAGNRALGERLHMLARAEAMRSAVALLLLAPSIPLLFMGEEFAAASPFLFFCDFEAELAAAVRDGRAAEFAHDVVPDPGAVDTMTQSRLDWSSVERGAHAAWHARYRDLLAMRTARIVPLIPRIVAGGARHEGDERTLDVRWPLADGRKLRVALDLDQPPPRSPGELLWQDDGAWHVRWTLDHE